MVTSDLSRTSAPLDWTDALVEIGERCQVSSNQPIELLDRSAAWWVAEGSVELFAMSGDEQAGRRTHFLSVGEGQFIFNLGHHDRACRLIALSLADAVLLRIPIGALARLSIESDVLPQLATGVDAWINSLFAELLDDVPPVDFVPLSPGDEVRLEPGQAARPELSLAWVRHVDGATRFLGRDEHRLEPADDLMPIGERTWLVADDGEPIEERLPRSWSEGAAAATAATATDTDTEQPESEAEPVKITARLSVVSTEVLLRGGRLWTGLERFHEIFLDWLERRLLERTTADSERLQERLRLDERALEGASAELASAIGAVRRPRGAAPREVASDLLKVCRWVGDTLGVAIKAPSQSLSADRIQTQGPSLRRICEASRIRYRMILLRDDWWKRDNGPLIGYRTKGPEASGAGGQSGGESRPVALIPRSAKSYFLVDPREPAEEPVTEDVAKMLSPQAFMLYPPLPARAVTWLDLLKLAFSDRWSDLSTLVLTGAATGLLALAVPLITARLFGEVIPDADRPQLLLLTLALSLAALTSTAFQVTRSIAMIRLGGKIDGSLQAALWDRLMSMPVSFFKRFTVGDLAKRAMGIDTIREELIGRVLGAVLGALFSVFSFFLLFWFSTTLALVALGLVGLLALWTLGLSWIELRYQRQLLDLQGRLSSLVFGLIHGISKLRLAGAEHRAYSLWAERFAEQRRVTWRARRVSIVQIATNGAYGVFTLLTLFAMVGLSQKADMPVSEFLGFNAAFGQFQAAVLSMISVVSSILALVPVYDRLRPILTTSPEVDDSKAEATNLSGDVELSHISFRYSADGPLILDDLSLRAEAGQFIALVGPSGSGKSTTLRLILGFEVPDSGSLYFDGQDLPSLNLQSVRRQIGVVLQNGRPIAGDILSNIVGSTSLTIEDAWRAAELAGLADDIRAMPMGMHTLVSEGAGTFSGGQKQRLLIARAVAHRPRILLFDEATSALDNRTQDVVSHSLERLKATRMVVAHRLSTVVRADRIYVLDKGRVVQQGTYEELMASDGVFRRLAERQIA